MNKRDRTKLEDVASKLGVSPTELDAHLIPDGTSGHNRPGLEPPRSTDKGMSIVRHRIFTWLIPISGAVIATLLAVILQWKLRAEKRLVLFIPLMCFALPLFLNLWIQRAHVACPKCGARLSYYPAKHSKMARYTCKGCGFRDR